MKDGDFYKILEISMEASAAEIKRAYRRLALQYHPDTNDGGAEAENRFKQINEAYSVLGNQEKRKAYDLKGNGPFNRSGNRPGAFGFRTCGAAKGPRCMGRGLASCLGNKRGGAAKAFRHPFSRYHHERGAVYDIHLTRDEALLGTEKVINIGKEPNAVTLRVRIQARLNDGDFLIIKNGNPWRNGGDIYLRVRFVE